MTLADSSDYNTGQAGTQGLRFARDLTSIVGLGLIDDVGTAAFSPEDLLGGIVDSESAGLGAPEALDISPAGDLVLLDSQSGAGQFSLYSYFLSPGGELTPTGFTLAKPFKLADLQFIPPRTPVTLAGDANVDGVVDSADIVFFVNEAMPDDKPILLPQNFANADLDQDVDVDQDDLEGLVAMLVGATP